MHVTHEYIRVDREKPNITLYKDGHAIWSAPVGVGRPSLPTPAGHFYVMEKLQSVGDSAYGPYAFGTSAYAPTLSEWPGGGVVGIHGTDEPQLIPGYPSHGCIRLRNAESSTSTAWSKSAPRSKSSEERRRGGGARCSPRPDRDRIRICRDRPPIPPDHDRQRAGCPSIPAR